MKTFLTLLGIVLAQAAAFSQAPSGLPASFNIGGLADYQYQSGGSSSPNGAYVYSETRRVTGEPFWWDTAFYTNSAGWVLTSPFASNEPGFDPSTRNVNFGCPKPGSGGYAAFYCNTALSVLATNPVLHLLIPGGAYVPAGYDLSGATFALPSPGSGGEGASSPVTVPESLLTGLTYENGQWVPAH